MLKLIFVTAKRKIERTDEVDKVHPATKDGMSVHLPFLSIVSTISMIRGWALATLSSWLLDLVHGLEKVPMYPPSIVRKSEIARYLQGLPGAPSVQHQFSLPTLSLWQPGGVFHLLTYCFQYAGEKLTALALRPSHVCSCHRWQVWTLSRSSLSCQQWLGSSTWTGNGRNRLS